MSKYEKDPKAEPEEVQRWTAKRRTALVVSIIKGETSPQEAARKHGLTVAEVEAQDGGAGRSVPTVRVPASAGVSRSGGAPNERRPGLPPLAHRRPPSPS